MPKPSAGAAALEPRHERELVVDRHERRGDALEPARRLTLSWAPTRKSANVTAPIQPAKRRSASANADHLPLR
jgi:hypothetical protein